VRRGILPLLIGMAAAGCGQQPQEQKTGPQTAEQVAEEMASMKLEPGQWEATNEVISASSPALPKEALQQMTGQKTTVSNCVTPEQAAKPSANFLSAQKGLDCTYEDVAMRGGKIAGTMSCRGGAIPGEVRTRLSGTYEAERYEINMKMETGVGPASITIDARTTGRRVGECTGAAG
jgi:hypothetical protein